MSLCDIGTLTHTTQEHIDTGDTLAQRRGDTVEVDAGTNERGDIGTWAQGFARLYSCTYIGSKPRFVPKKGTKSLYWELSTLNGN